ncbi:MAG: hypothetical protein WDW38_004559 [Sanguina aurantia]
MLCAHAVCSSCIRQNLDYRSHSNNHSHASAACCPECREACEVSSLRKNDSLRQAAAGFGQLQPALKQLLDAHRAAIEAAAVASAAAVSAATAAAQTSHPFETGLPPTRGRRATASHRQQHQPSQDAPSILSIDDSPRQQQQQQQGQPRLRRLTRSSGVTESEPSNTAPNLDDVALSSDRQAHGLQQTAAPRSTSEPDVQSSRRTAVDVPKPRVAALESTVVVKTRNLHDLHAAPIHSTSRARSLRSSQPLDPIGAGQEASLQAALPDRLQTPLHRPAHSLRSEDAAAGATDAGLASDNDAGGVDDDIISASVCSIQDPGDDDYDPTGDSAQGGRQRSDQEGECDQQPPSKRACTAADPTQQQQQPAPAAAASSLPPRVAACKGGTPPSLQSSAACKAGYVPCPLCKFTFSSSFIHSHVHSCMEKQERTREKEQQQQRTSHNAHAQQRPPQQQQQQQQQQSHHTNQIIGNLPHQHEGAHSAPARGPLPPANGTATTPATQQQRRAGAPASPSVPAIEVPAKLVMHILKDKDLKAKLVAIGLPVDGKRTDMVERYHAYRRYLQTALDAGSSLGQAQLRRAFVAEERRLAEGRRATPKVGASAHSSNFDDLIEQTRQRCRAAVKPEPADATPSGGEAGDTGAAPEQAAPDHSPAASAQRQSAEAGPSASHPRTESKAHGGTHQGHGVEGEQGTQGVRLTAPHSDGAPLHNTAGGDGHVPGVGHGAHPTSRGDHHHTVPSAAASASGATAAASAQDGVERCAAAAGVPLAGRGGCHADGSRLGSVTGAPPRRLQDGDVCMIEVHEVEDSE